MSPRVEAIHHRGVAMAPVLDEDSGQHELLATAVQTTAEDDSLAAEYSLLAHPDLSQVMECRRWPYIVAWVPMMIIAGYVALKVALFRLVIRPSDKERMLLGPERGTLWFDARHRYGSWVRNGVTTSKALDVIYSIPVAIPRPTTKWEWLARFWLDQPDGQAVRNRLRITYKEMLDELESLYAKGIGHDEADPIRTLHLACGSAQAAIEATAEFLRRHPEAHIKLKLVDLSLGSLRRASRLAQARGVGHLISIADVDLKAFVNTAARDGKQWHLVEMVGFLDYRKKNSLVEICSAVRKILKMDGLFIGAHINPSPWSFAVRWVINWPLLARRTPKEFHTLLLQSAFNYCEIQLNTEPNHIHTVCLCRRRHE